MTCLKMLKENIEFFFLPGKQNKLRVYYLSWLKAKILKGEEVFYTAVLTDVQTLFRVESNILLAVKTFCCTDIVKEKQFCSQTRLVGEMRKCAVKIVKGYKVKHHPFSQKNSSKTTL